MMSERGSKYTSKPVPRFSDDCSQSAASPHELFAGVGPRKHVCWSWILSTLVFACTTAILFIQSLWHEPRCLARNPSTELGESGSIMPLTLKVSHSKSRYTSTAGQVLRGSDMERKWHPHQRTSSGRKNLGGRPKPRNRRVMGWT